jgi:hypothetical protein
MTLDRAFIFAASVLLCVPNRAADSHITSRALPVPTVGKTGFEKLSPAQTGINFTNFLSDPRSVANRNLLSGSGVACGDIDGDGLCDLYFCGLDADNKLFRNLGNWKFEDITASVGVACHGQDSMGAAFADVDGDGDLDLLVNALGNGTRLFLNDGKGHFTEVTDAAGLRSQTGAMSLALGDLDGDGDLDLYVANFHPTTIKDNPHATVSVQMIDGRAQVASIDGRPATAPDLTNRFAVAPSGAILEFGEADAIYLNDGKGHFKPLSWTDGAFLDEKGKPLREPPRDWSLAVQIRDLNGDGLPDIYVCSDLFTPDRVWINDGHARFHALDNFALRSTPTFSMGVDFADIDRDGHLDWFMVDMFSRSHRKQHTQLMARNTLFPIGMIDVRPQLLRNTLHWNRGDNTFAEIGWYAGVEASDWSWGPIFIDVDLDGYEDILVANGQLRDYQDLDLAMALEAAERARRLSAAEIAEWHHKFPRLDTPNVAFRNRHDLTFEEVGAAWGFATPGISQGMALADLDNDGDLDVIVNNLNAAAGIYRNIGIAPRVAVRLKGTAPNTRGIGAKIQIFGGPGGPAPQQQEMIAGGRYLSGDDPIRSFAAGSATNKLRIEVTWRNGLRSFVDEGTANTLYEIDESGATNAPSLAPEKPKVTPIFEDASNLIAHFHNEAPFDDFQRQPLIPNSLSQLGPGVCWFDLDGDGWDDLFVGSGKGGGMGVFKNNQHGGFEPIRNVMTRPTLRDQTTIIGAAGRLVVGYSNYEDGLTNELCARVFDFKNRTSNEGFDSQPWSVGPMAIADIDGDGDLDLFIGGRVIPGRYPEAASSVLLANENGKLTKIHTFDQLGLVSGAVFSDLDGDGLPELIVACEWSPIRIFHNDHGKWIELTEKLGFAPFVGWWNGVTTGDIDGDGRLDIIASNWGLNSKYRATRENPLLLYYGDLTGQGSVDVIEAQFDPAMQKEVPLRDMRAVGPALIFVAEKMHTFAAYGQASIAEIYGDALKNMKSLSANTLQSMIFFNRGDHFEAVPLPREAQFTPAFGICVSDMDGDGNEDIFLSQNFFATAVDTSRNDAGRGLWLRGDGKGGLQPVSGEESGIKVYGEQRGCALGDFDADGRIDLVVTQNGAQTKLYHNTGAKPGLRIRLNGPPENPSGIGATIRFKSANGFGPAREIHAGSGYWSQDSAIQVMAAPPGADQISIHWPGGKTTTSALPANTREITIDQSGAVQVAK